MQNDNFDELMSGQKLMTVMGYILGATGLVGLGKLLVVPHDLQNGFIVLVVCGITLCFAWMIITDGRRTERFMVAAKTAGLKRRRALEDQQASFRQQAIQTVSIANRLTETKVDQATGQRVVSIPADEAADMARVLSQVSHDFSDLADKG